VVAGNFTPVERTYRIGVPTGGFWEEALNTNASAYAGSGLGNLGGVQSQPISSHGFSQSIEVCLPGLSLLIFRKTTV
jgi:1,4-alpha-glucan branching enzyme